MSRKFKHTRRALGSGASNIYLAQTSLDAHEDAEELSRLGARDLAILYPSHHLSAEALLRPAPDGDLIDVPPNPPPVIQPGLFGSG